jgi:hypothetical protein
MSKIYYKTSVQALHLLSNKHTILILIQVAFHNR